MGKRFRLLFLLLSIRKFKLLVFYCQWLGYVVLGNHLVYLKFPVKFVYLFWNYLAVLIFKIIFALSRNASIAEDISHKLVGASRFLAYQQHGSIRSLQRRILVFDFAWNTTAAYEINFESYETILFFRLTTLSENLKDQHCSWTRIKTFGSYSFPRSIIELLWVCHENGM